MFPGWECARCESESSCEPRAGALCLVRYNSPSPSYDICERVRVAQSVLIVPGAHLGLEGFLRLWLGGKPEFLREGLRRVGVELRKEFERTQGQHA